MLEDYFLLANEPSNSVSMIMLGIVGTLGFMAVSHLKNSSELYQREQLERTMKRIHRRKKYEYDRLVKRINRDHERKIKSSYLEV